MKLVQDWKQNYLFLLLLLPGIFSVGISAVIADETTNTAVLGGDNIQPVTSNTVFFTRSATALEIVKTADRIAVEPGDTVVYRLAIRNTGNSPASNITLTDTLPLGLNFETRSLQVSLTSSNTTTPVTVSNSQDNSTVTINYAGTISAQGTMNVAYAVTVTPDAVRGTGKNLAVAAAGNIRSNTASHLLKIRPGIISDCATLIGRVFIDKNFDGEQQPGEPGIPNAVIYMDDGNRILTDANGMFSLANVIAGNRTGTLDLTSLPGYSLAPNLYNIEKNSQSRLVRLSPRSMGRMNFAVTPASGEGRK
ncbi:isopeptide-forming domain-containing fimbrial protein [Nostoc cycadae]|uniref:isopeptide-forming domain-containing fimbrial protein n=1 Tax=Nostoc cycadae TaxID=246795 RepID=UPI000CCC6E2A|nr:isopeptide-forming domain-containing fimbrial protein [Nostoc cycadae]